MMSGGWRDLIYVLAGGVILLTFIDLADVGWGFLDGRLGVRYHWGCLFLGIVLAGWPGFVTFFSYGIFSNAQLTITITTPRSCISPHQ